MQFTGHKKYHNDFFYGESMTLQGKLEQCRKNKTAAEKEEQKILEQIEKDIQFGDIVVCRGCPGLIRVALFDSDVGGRLAVYNRDGQKVNGINDINEFYRKTGKNIFENGLLNLTV